MKKRYLVVFSDRKGTPLYYSSSRAYGVHWSANLDYAVKQSYENAMLTLNLMEQFCGDVEKGTGRLELV